jgi:tetratricopeptide (TPR) repeat protein
VSRAIESHIEQDPALSAGPRARAIEAAEAALRLDPASAAAYVALSIVKPICGHFKERDSLIAAALEAAPSDPAALFWAGRWRWTVGRLHDFVSHLERCRLVDPLWPQGVHQCASALWVVGRRDAAVSVWDHALARWPELDYLYAAQLGFASMARDWERVDDLLRALHARGPRTRGIVLAVRHA